MTKHPGKTLPPLYITTPAPCPYLPGRKEKKVFTHLLGDQAPRIHDMLSLAGFRRSQNIAYRPACDGCNACISVRIVVDEFDFKRGYRRTARQNADLITEMRAPAATREQFSLLRDYLDTRHAEGGMADMTIIDYTAMVEETTVDTHLVEYRLPPADAQDTGKLVAVALIDQVSDGLSMVYSFYDTAEASRGLGTYMVLDHIRRCRLAGLPYLYLGYWVDGCGKMAYKARFEPLEALSGTGWSRLETHPSGTV